MVDFSIFGNPLNKKNYIHYMGLGKNMSDASNTILIVIQHIRERHFFENAFRLAGRFEKMKKSRERVCNSTISMGEGGKNQLCFHILMKCTFVGFAGGSADRKMQP